MNADCDGRIGRCRSIPATDAQLLAYQYPEFSLRTEPTHREAFVAVSAGTRESPIQWFLVSKALHAWAIEHVIDLAKLGLIHEDLGVRITYRATDPITAASVPHFEFAVQFV